jgi:eukaryotic-like serine/threonine-protein kinase
MSTFDPDTSVTLVPGGSAPRGPGAHRAAQRLGRYEVLEEIGRGAMGIVYRARDPVINREVALKTIPLAAEFEGADLAEARGKFFREAEAAGRLSHPHIVTIYDAGEHEGTAYIAMEMLRGRHLVEFTHPARLLAVDEAIRLVMRLAEALHYAHRQGVVHRDVKPANVMHDPPSGELRITDFGIARLTDSGRSRTGIVLGTPSYMSPEQLQGRPVTGRSDLFSLAVTLFQLLSGQLPFRADSMPGLMIKIAHEPAPPIDVVRPGLPRGLQPFFERALAKDPQARHASGAEFAEALRGLSDGRG